MMAYFISIRRNTHSFSFSLGPMILSHDNFYTSLTHDSFYTNTRRLLTSNHTLMFNVTAKFNSVILVYVLSLTCSTLCTVTLVTCLVHAQVSCVRFGPCACFVSINKSYLRNRSLHLCLHFIAKRQSTVTVSYLKVDKWTNETVPKWLSINYCLNKCLFPLSCSYVLEAWGHWWCVNKS